MEQFCLELLEKKSTLTVPGSCFEREGYARIGYACNAEVLKEGLNRLSLFLR